MKYLAIDIETTSLKPEDDQILSFAAVLEDTENIKPVKDLPSFYCMFKYDKIRGENYALSMHPKLLREIATSKKSNIYEIKSKPFSLKLDFDDFNENFYNFLKENKLDCYKLKVAGKNASAFDIPWIRNKVDGYKTYFDFSHRVLDVGSVMVDFKEDDWIPNSEKCKERAELKDTDVSHNALEDCYDVIKCLRTKYNG